MSWPINTTPRPNKNKQKHLTGVKRESPMRSPTATAVINDIYPVLRRIIECGIAALRRHVESDSYLSAYMNGWIGTVLAWMHGAVLHAAAISNGQVAEYTTLWKRVEKLEKEIKHVKERKLELKREGADQRATIATQAAAIEKHEETIRNMCVVVENLLKERDDALLRLSNHEAKTFGVPAKVLTEKNNNGSLVTNLENDVHRAFGTKVARFEYYCE